MRVVPLSQAGTEAGAKARNLRRLIEHGYRVPQGVVVLPGDETDPRVLAAQLERHIDPSKSYAVRSSADVEDSGEWSFAGQFETRLGVAGVEQLGEAVAAVAVSAHDPRVEPYLRHAGIDPSSVSMAVIVQELVEPEASGVAFSRNPLTGLDEIVIETVEGRGDVLVSGEATPERWVRRWGEWTERPPTGGEWAHLDELAETVGRVARQWGHPVDIEWAWDGAGLHLLQVRPLTSAGGAVYSNRMSREYLPGMIPPLVWTINVPVVNGAWLELFESLVGPLDLRPEDLARQFAYRAYFNMQAVGDVFEALGMPRDLLEVLMGLPGGSDRPSFRPGPQVVRHLPRMVAAGGRLLRYDRELDRVIPELEKEFASMESRPPTELTNEELVAAIAALEDLTGKAAFANIVAPLLMNAYGSRLRRRLEAAGIDPHQVDPAEAEPDMALFDPNPHLARLAEAASALEPEGRERVAAGDLSPLPEARPFLERFGHLSDSGNDFSSVPWREDPSLLGPVILHHAHPSRRQVSPPLPRRLRRLSRRAGRFRLERERVSYLYTRGYGMFRPLVREAGRRLTQQGILGAPDDVFFLTRHEMTAALGGEGPGRLRDRVEERRAEMSRLVDISMPEVIYGDDFEPAPPSDPEHRLVGLPTSRGIHRAPARIVHGIGEASRVVAGDVVVIPYSDVGWTPVLARAGAIVAESGGMLSHSSIVAREFGIPCVVSVSGAMGIPDGAIIRVDGYTGEVQWEPREA